LRAGAVHDPSVDGAITSVNFSYDLFHFNPPPSQAVAFGLLVLQNGTYYKSTDDLAFDAAWIGFSRVGVTALDLDKISGPAGDHPDFSAAGSPLQFGYFSRNTSDAASLHREGGIDNWSVTTLPEPTCVSAALLAAALSLAFRHRSSRHEKR
jgi:hypothetical protein